MDKLKLFISVVVLLLSSSYASAQIKIQNSYHEIGGSIGINTIASDYKQLYQFGGEFSLTHRVGWRNSKYVIKSEIGYSKINNTDYEDVSTSFISYASQLEYNFLDYGFLHDGGGKYKWTPYMALGVNFVNFKINNDDNLKDMPYEIKQTGVVFGAKLAIGARFNINPFLSIFVEANTQYMFSDDIDGRNPDSDVWLNNWNDHMGRFVIGFTQVIGY